MKKLNVSASSLLFISFLIIFSACTKKYSWIEFISEENNYKIKFPEKPISHDPTFRSFGNVTIKIDQYDYKDEVLHFNALSYSYSEVVIKNAAGLDSLFDYLIHQTLFKNKISIQNKTNLKIKEHPGKEFRIKFKDLDTEALVRIYMMENNKLQINIVTTNTNPGTKFSQKNTKDAHYFLDSFDIINEY